MQNQERFQYEKNDFDRGDAGASLTNFAQCSTLRKNGFVNIKDRPCKIVDIHSSKTGKHGHCKVAITGLDIFTDKRYQIVHPASHNVDIPLVNRVEYILVDAGKFLSLMDDKGFLRYDIPTPDGELGQTIQSKLAANGDETITVTILSAMGEDMVIGVKTSRE